MSESLRRTCQGVDRDGAGPSVISLVLASVISLVLAARNGFHDWNGVDLVLPFAIPSHMTRGRIDCRSRKKGRTKGRYSSIVRTVHALSFSELLEQTAPKLAARYVSLTLSPYHPQSLSLSRALFHSGTRTIPDR